MGMNLDPIYSKHVHIWWLEFSQFEAYLTSLKPLLSNNELARAARFKFSEHRSHYILGRGILRKLLSQYLNLSPDEIKLGEGEKGKPFLEIPGCDLHFNVAHSYDYIVYAFRTQQEIGIDIEKLAVKPYLNLAQRFFHLKEYDSLLNASSEAQQALFFKFWTAKEALVKVSGSTIFTALPALTQPDLSKQTLAFLDKVFHLEFFEINTDYPGAFATLAPIEQLSFKQCLPAHLGF